MRRSKMHKSESRGCCSLSPAKCRRILLVLTVAAGLALVGSMFLEWESLGLGNRLDSFKGQPPSLGEKDEIVQAAHFENGARKAHSDDDASMGKVVKAEEADGRSMTQTDIKEKIKRFKEESSKQKEVKIPDHSQDVQTGSRDSKQNNLLGDVDEDLPEMAAKPATAARADQEIVRREETSTPIAEPISAPVTEPVVQKRRRVTKSPKRSHVEKAKVEEAPPADENEPEAEVHQTRTYPTFVTRPPRKEKYACTVPEVNPWDKTILKLVEHFPPKICRKVQADLVYIDENNFLRFNQSELKLLNMTEDDVECGFNTIERGDNEEDFQADLGPTRALTKNVQLEKDVVQVSCVRRDDRSVLYGELLTYPVLDKTKKYADNSEDMLNVILIFVDSLSLSAMRRHMPMTYQFMEKEMGFKAMTGYNKVADNSFPNLIPMLTGKRAQTQQPDMLDEFNEDISVTYFDHWPLIWKQFAAKGYVTAFSEEFPDLGLFHLKGYGFRKKPVDHFYINFWKALEWLTFSKKPTQGCYGNRTPAQILLNIIRNHLTKFKNLAQFLYMYLTFPAHTNAAEMEYVDIHYYNFFKEMHERQMFNRSFVMFLADHGPRVSVLRTTTVGLLEERLPACLIYFPPWFYKKHPHIEENLRLNEDRLASNFDVYETLVDVLKENYAPTARQRPATSRGMSFLYPIPTNRTCRSAGIPLYFCTCQQMKWTNIPIGSAMAKYAAVDFVYALNENVQKNQLCTRWTLKKLLNAEIMDIDARDAGVTVPPSNGTQPPVPVANSDVYKTNLQLVRVTVQAEVSFVTGTFQALMLFNKDENQLSLHSDIGRLDKYGNQSSCIGNDANNQIKKLCVCRTFILNETSTRV